MRKKKKKKVRKGGEEGRRGGESTLADNNLSETVDLPDISGNLRGRESKKEKRRKGKQRGKNKKKQKTKNKKQKTKNKKQKTKNKKQKTKTNILVSSSVPNSPNVLLGLQIVIHTVPNQSSQEIFALGTRENNIILTVVNHNLVAVKERGEVASDTPHPVTLQHLKRAIFGEKRGK